MVSIVMGSDSDKDVVEKVVKTLQDYDVDFTLNIISAHRTPERLYQHVTQSQADVFIGVAGKAAHLAGVIASYTIKPVIGLPVKTSDLGGMDSLLSMVQMPSGVPVATVAINGGENAALLAIQMLAICDKKLQESLRGARKQNVKALEQKDLDCQNW